MLNIVLFGPPGAGKGTQSKKLQEEYELVHISTGDVFRENIKNKTELGIQAKQYMNAGKLVPDNVTIGMLEKEFEKNKNSKGIIFDGFPRTVAQAEALDQLLNKYQTAISCMVELKVENEELIKRLLLRGKDSGRADDKNEELIKERINEYNLKTAPVASYYKNKGIYQAVQGIGSIDAIYKSICETLQKEAT